MDSCISKPSSSAGRAERSSEFGILSKQGCLQPSSRLAYPGGRTRSLGRLHMLCVDVTERRYTYQEHASFRTREESFPSTFECSTRHAQGAMSSRRSLPQPNSHAVFIRKGNRSSCSYIETKRSTLRCFGHRNNRGVASTRRVCLRTHNTSSQLLCQKRNCHLSR